MMNRKVFKLPQLIAEVILAQKHIDTNLVVAGGRTPDISWLQEAAVDKTVYCADKGIEICMESDLIPDEIYGDGDSAEQQLYWQASALGTKVRSFNPEKDDTDLQLLLKNIPASDLVCTGVWGGRFDHLYSNVFSLLAYKLQQQAQVILADEQEVMLLLNTQESVKLKFTKQPTALSLLPLGKDTVVNLEGVHWPLSNAKIKLLQPYAISNIPEQKCICQCMQGIVGVYVTFSK